ncbi:MAG: alpha/beta hydrolase [Steroidobacteraceae bacterium]
MKRREMEFQGCADVRLYAQAWLPEEPPQMLLAISHGLAEHGGRYSAMAEQLVPHGCAVYALDHRGHGRSSGNRANIDSFEFVVSDLGTFIGRAQRQHPGVPVVLLGHSMGGAIALACALRYQDVLRALVLSAPALAPPEPPSAFRRLTLRAMSAMRPDKGVLQLPASQVSRDPEVVAAYQRDPLVFRGPIPARTIAELLDGMEQLAGQVQELRLPVLVQHGTADRLVPLATVQPLYQKLGMQKRRTVMLYDGLYHEVYNEPERERVLRDLCRWLAI